MAYINNQCVEIKANFDLDGVEGSIVTDAPSFVLGVVPIDEHVGFSISTFVEKPSVVALDFNSDRRMWATLGRISYFVEMAKPGQPPILDHCYNGSCARGEGYDLELYKVACFYNQAKLDGIQLNNDEKTLLGILAEKGLLIKDGGVYRPANDYVLIGMSRESNIYKRKIIFEHEYSHALYFVDWKFRDEVSLAWNGLDQNQRNLLRGAMIASGIYSSGNQWLIETEVQAHAIASPLDEDGFINLLIGAYENCSSGGDAEGCRQFRSFHGNIESTLMAVHDTYTELSECTIPMLSSGYFMNGTFIGNFFPCECDNNCFSVSNSDVAKVNIETIELNSLSNFDSFIIAYNAMTDDIRQRNKQRLMIADGWIERIQKWFDKLHGKSK